MSNKLSLLVLGLSALAACAAPVARDVPRGPSYQLPEEVLRDPQRRLQLTEQLRRKMQHERTPDSRAQLLAAGLTASEVSYILGPETVTGDQAPEQSSVVSHQPSGSAPESAPPASDRASTSGQPAPKLDLTTDN
jgi:hypothetical protein